MSCSAWCALQVSTLLTKLARSEVVAMSDHAGEVSMAESFLLISESRPDLDSMTAYWAVSQGSRGACGGVRFIARLMTLSRSVMSPFDSMY